MNHRNDELLVSSGPQETREDRISRTPAVLRAYAKNIDEKLPLDSGASSIIRFAADVIEHRERESLLFSVKIFGSHPYAEITMHSDAAKNKEKTHEMFRAIFDAARKWGDTNEQFVKEKP